MGNSEDGEVYVIFILFVDGSPIHSSVVREGGKGRVGGCGVNGQGCPIK